MIRKKSDMYRWQYRKGNSTDELQCWLAAENKVQSLANFVDID